MSLSEAALNEIHAVAESGFVQWRDNSTEEQKAVGLQQLAKYTTDPEYAAAEMANCQAMFNAADADADGFLNAAEYSVFDNAIDADKASRGGYVDGRPEQKSAIFAAFDLVNTEENGVSWAAWQAGMAEIVQKFGAYGSQWTHIGLFRLDSYCEDILQIRHFSKQH